MESIIDRVINEIAWRLTGGAKAARAARAAEPSPPPAPMPPRAEPTPPPQAEPEAQESYPPDMRQEDDVVNRELEMVLAEARRELDAAALIVAELRESADGFTVRISAMGQRLDEIGGRLMAQRQSVREQVAPPPPPPPPPIAYAPPPPEAPSPQQPPAAPPPQQQPQAPTQQQPPPPPAQPQQQPTPPLEISAGFVQAQATEPPPPPYVAPPEQRQDAAVTQVRTVSLTVAALANLTVVSVVETALLRISGVREVTLRQLLGREAVLDVRLDDGTELIAGLRHSLPLAFDVTESSEDSLAISLTHPEAHSQLANGGGTSTRLA